MKICRFGANRLGLVEGAQVRDVSAALEVLPSYQYPWPQGDPLLLHWEAVVARARALAAAAPVLPLAGLPLLSPVANPGKIVAAPVNYQKHLNEVKDDAGVHHGNVAHTITIHSAGLFLKATSALVGAGAGIQLRHLDRRNDHEVELVAIIGKQANHVAAHEALDYVAGYAIGLDITLRGSEDRSFRKSVDSYAVLGPWLVTADEIAEPGNLDLTLAVNGAMRQASNTKHLILNVPELIALASSFYTLYPGDLLYTGTPEGIGPIAPGDQLVATIERIGTMNVAVRAA
ncbi:MAG: fumarylacetoacetate hydrolase family protein [Acidobacteria bacterium]|nr:fumarylacetoacetate hydrolase family protein [Acidobacteriota bacterium]MBI3425425.1 fumarylacetoacetate hydrolase family protein [Acidobacteriota bacterium]